MDYVSFIRGKQEGYEAFDPFMDLKMARPAIRHEGRIYPLASLGCPAKSWNERLLQGKTEESELLNTLETLPEEEGYPEEEVRLLSPIPQPLQDVLCIGKNYVAPGEEKQPRKRLYFGKRSWRIAGPMALLPRQEEPFLVETELAVILGRPLYRATAEEAQAAIWGYSVFCDCTSPALAERFDQAYVCKSLAGFSVMGPAILPAKNWDGEAFLLSAYVNGEQRQQGSSADMLCPVTEMLVELSRYLPLAPGTILSTGTPEPGAELEGKSLLLHPGDEVLCHIDGIGDLPFALAK